MGQGKTILVAVATSMLVTGVILGLAVPQVLKRAQRRMLGASAAVMAEAFNALARSVETNVARAQAEAQPNAMTTTWPVPDAAFKYAN